MHAPSALVAGAVLTFGAAALANLYLPAGAQTPLAAAAAPIEQVAVITPLPAAATEPAPDADLDTSFALTTQDSTQQVFQSFVSNQTAELAGPHVPASVDEPVAAPEPAIPAAEPVQEPPHPARKPVAAAPKKKPAQKPAAERQESRAEEDKQSSAFAPTSAVAPAIFGHAPPAARRSEAASVSAISAGRAWVRLGDSHTVAVQAGDALPTFGRITAVSADAVTFENGTVLRIQP